MSTALPRPFCASVPEPQGGLAPLADTCREEKRPERCNTQTRSSAKGNLPTIARPLGHIECTNGYHTEHCEPFRPRAAAALRPYLRHVLGCIAEHRRSKRSFASADPIAPSLDNSFPPQDGTEATLTALAITVAVLLSAPAAAQMQNALDKEVATKNQRNERAKEHCTQNHGVNCDTPEGLKEWLLLDRSREEAVREGSHHLLPGQPSPAPSRR